MSSSKINNSLNNSNPSKIQQNHTTFEDEEELNAILEQTQGITHYTDNDIGHLLNPKHYTDGNKDSLQSSGKPPGKISITSNDSASSSDRRGRRYSDLDFSSQSFLEDTIGLLKDGDQNLASNNPLYSQNTENQNSQSDSEKTEESIDSDQSGMKSREKSRKLPASFLKVHKQYQYLQTPIPIEEVHKSYPLFLLSKPKYQLPETVHQKVIKYPEVVTKSQIKAVDIGFKKETNTFHVLLGGKGCHVNFFEPQNQNSSIKNIQVFRQPSVQTLKKINNGKIPESIPDLEINCLKWSPSMMHFAVSNNFQEFKVFQMQRQTHKSSTSSRFDYPDELQWLQTPIEVLNLSSLKTQISVMECHFLEELPEVKMLLVDNKKQVYILQMRKSFIHYKPVIRTLPIFFPGFKNVRTSKIYAQNDGKPGTLLLVEGEYLTIAVLQPKFEVLIVYDREKHCPKIEGIAQQDTLYPHAEFLTQRNRKSRRGVQGYSSEVQILIVWGRYVEVLSLSFQAFTPVSYTRQTKIKYILSDQTLSVGAVSDSIIYQLNRQFELKLYSLNEFAALDIRKNKNFTHCPPKYADPIHQEQIPAHSITNLNIREDGEYCIEEVASVSSRFRIASQRVFIFFDEEIKVINLESFPQYVEGLVQQVNDWKVGLQMLCEGVNLRLTKFDNISLPRLHGQIKEYSLRYIDYLRGLIDGPSESAHSDIWMQEMSFLLNILVESGEAQFLMKEILLKLYRLSPQLLKVFEPFIMMHRIKVIEESTLDLLFSVLSRQASKRLIYSIEQTEDTSRSVVEIDNGYELHFCLSSHQNTEIVHMINPILIRFDLLMEVIWLNSYFGDFYTPFVILIAQHRKRTIQKNSSQRIENEGLSSDTLEIQQERDAQFATQSQETVIHELISYACLHLFLQINTSDSISENKAEYLIETVLHLFTEELYEILIEFCPNSLFQHILEALLNGRCLEYLNRSGQRLRAKRRQKQKQDEQGGQQSEDTKVPAQNDFITEIIKNIPYRTVVKHSAQSQYWSLIMSLIERGLIEGSQFKLFNGIYFLTVDYLLKDTEISLSEKHGVTKKINRFVRDCWTLLYSTFMGVETHLKEELFSHLLKSQCVQLLKLIGEQLNRQLQVLDTMIITKSCHNIELIQYVQEFVSQCKEKARSKELIKIKLILQENIKLFTEIDPEAISSLIIRHFPGDIKEFIGYLDQNPKQQMLLLKEILCISNYGEELNREKLQYLELLAISAKGDVILAQLQNHMFPLDEAIRICEKYEILNALAFLLVKSGGSGDTTRAIGLYFNLIEQKIDVYRMNRRTHESWLALSSYMVQQLKKCIKICIDLDLRGNLQYETEWFFIISELQSLKGYIYRTCNPEVEGSIRCIINEQLYPILIQELLQEVTQENLVDYLEKTIESMEPQTTELIISSMVKAYFFEGQILKISQQTLTENEIFTRKKIVRAIHKGFVTNSRCFECMRKDSLIKIHYSCGHELHPDCNYDIKECFVCNATTEGLFKKLINQKEKLQKWMVYSVNEEAEISQQERKRHSKQQRLKNFDRELEMGRSQLSQETFWSFDHSL